MKFNLVAILLILALTLVSACAIAETAAVDESMPLTIKVGEAEEMSDIDVLMAIEEIKQLKARYFRTIDTKQFDNLATVFAPDAWFDSEEGLLDPIAGQYPGFDKAPLWETREGIIENVRAAMPDALQSAHMGHTPEIVITSPTTAKGIIPFNDRLYIPEVLSANGYGYYHETYTKIDGQWYIQTSRIERLRVVFGE